MNHETPLERGARVFATIAHANSNQARKYTGVPYITHPAAVVELVRSVPHTPEMLAAAWLHDVVEDTAIDIEAIQRSFGPEVAGMVDDLTDVSGPSHGNRAMRKAVDRQHTAEASPAAKTIKLADLIDNSSDILLHDAKFAKVYLAEKALLLPFLKEGDATLWQRANDSIMRDGLAS